LRLTTWQLLLCAFLSRRPLNRDRSHVKRRAPGQPLSTSQHLLKPATSTPNACDLCSQRLSSRPPLWHHPLPSQLPPPLKSSIARFVVVGHRLHASSPPSLPSPRVRIRIGHSPSPHTVVLSCEDVLEFRFYLHFFILTYTNHLAPRMWVRRVLCQNTSRIPPPKYT
jgi:hypothetical protein